MDNFKLNRLYCLTLSFYVGVFMKCILFFILLPFFSIFAGDVVIELLATEHDNEIWQTKNQMHLTIGHIKEVDISNLMHAIETFNSENKELLKKSFNKGFVVESFNTDGFNNGYHILEADADTTKRFDLINTKLYEYLKDEHFGTLTDKTTPKTINPKGYTPHLEFLESDPNKIPIKGDVIYFKDWNLQGRVLKTP